MECTPGLLEIVSGRPLGIQWPVFARHEKMAHTMRGGGSFDRYRAAGGGESIPSARDSDGQTIATGKSKAAVG
jgi:hypothetical protein